MSSIGQEARWKQEILKRIRKAKEQGDKHAVKRMAGYYRIGSVKVIYDWQKQWDGGWRSLVPKSHRPHGHPKAHTEQEVELIVAVHRECGFLEPLLLWQELRERGYTRSFGGMKRFVRKRFGTPSPPKTAKEKPKRYDGGTFPGERLQLDVKYVPSECVKFDAKLYQFTAVDEFSRWTYREIYDEHSTYSAKQFLLGLLRAAPFPICCVQTDNGSEWYNALFFKPKHKTLFEQALLNLHIGYRRIRIATPRHNGRVERQHGLDAKRFYRKLKFYSMEEARLKIALYNGWSNSRIKTCLDFKSPNQVLEAFCADRLTPCPIVAQIPRRVKGEMNAPRP